jgi:homoserine O-succinyltransferase/O-acetyltransferase
MPSSPQRTSGRRITVALVNNMPDAAFADTEHQFRRAIAAGGDEGEVQIDLYTMPGLARGEAIAAEIRSRYRGLEDLWSSHPDALILTGTEPVQSQLQFEPYWPDLSQLLQWAAAEVPSTLLSCLAAHASVLMFDGIQRQPLPEKCSGVFDGVVDAASGPLAAGLTATVAVPHSRVNDVPQKALLEAGYAIVIGSGDPYPGWSVATRTQGSGTFVLCQGHPEYSTESLLREYRRDVRRSLLGRGAVPYPSLPQGYLTEPGAALLDAFAAEAGGAGQDQDAMALYRRFPYEQAHGEITNRWADSSATLYLNWLAMVRAGAGSGVGLPGAA